MQVHVGQEYTFMTNGVRGGRGFMLHSPAQLFILLMHLSVDIYFFMLLFCFHIHMEANTDPLFKHSFWEWSNFFKYQEEKASYSTPLLKNTSTVYTVVHWLFPCLKKRCRLYLWKFATFEQYFKLFSYPLTMRTPVCYFLMHGVSNLLVIQI